jgi:hypothetical protein
MSNNYTVSEDEKYFFDLRGYLIVRGALSADEVKACNDAIDQSADKIKTRSVEDPLANPPSSTDRVLILSADWSIASLQAFTSSADNAPRTIKYPRKSKKYFSSSDTV